MEDFVDLLEGDVNFQAVKEALVDVAYDGYATIKLLPFEPVRSEKTVKAIKKSSNKRG